MRDVLLVEDDRAVLRAVASTCRSVGLQVDETTCVEQAVAKLGESGYRVALVDLMLPERSGFHLLSGVGNAGAPVSTVMITGYATIDNTLESFRLGAFDFLPKPFDVAELLGVVRRALRYGERRPGELLEQGVTAEPHYFLGRHSWAVLEVDGTAKLGAAETFRGLLPEIEHVELPTVGQYVAQGRKLVRLASADEVNRLWSPLSGQVIAVNSDLKGAVDELGSRPLQTSWLVRILPTAFDNEVEALTLRSLRTAVAKGG